MKQLLVITAYQFSSDDIGKLKEGVPNYLISKHLPRFCLTDSNTVTDSESYLQFVTSGEKKFHLFDINFASSYIQETIDQIGAYDFFRVLKTDYVGILSKLKLNSYGDYKKTIPTQSILVLEIEFNDEDYSLTFDKILEL
jgi:hypothetical protein